MKILITGANGMVGRSLVKLLSQKKNKIVCLDLTKNIYENNKIEYIECDLLNFPKLILKISKMRFDVIIHLAGFLGVKKSTVSELECIETNLQGTINILRLSKITKTKQIIYASSSEVYGDILKRPFKETDVCAPKSAYGVSKLAAETYIKAFCKKNKLNFKIIRYFNVYGPNQRKDFVIPKFVDLIKNNKSLTIYGSGKQIRSYCHVSDAATATIKVLKKGKKNNLYNVGNNSEPISLRNLVKVLKKITFKKINFSFVPFLKSDRTMQREIFFRIPNIRKIKSHTGYAPRISLGEGLKNLLND